MDPNAVKDQKRFKLSPQMLEMIRADIAQNDGTLDHEPSSIPAWVAMAVDKELGRRIRLRKALRERQQHSAKEEK